MTADWAGGITSPTIRTITQNRDGTVDETHVWSWQDWDRVLGRFETMASLFQRLGVDASVALDVDDMAMATDSANLPPRIPQEHRAPWRLPIHPVEVPLAEAERRVADYVTSAPQTSYHTVIHHTEEKTMPENTSEARQALAEAELGLADAQKSLDEENKLLEGIGHLHQPGRSCATCRSYELRVEAATKRYAAAQQRLTEVTRDVSPSLQGLLGDEKKPGLTIPEGPGRWLTDMELEQINMNIAERDNIPKDTLAEKDEKIASLESEVESVRAERDGFRYLADRRDKQLSDALAERNKFDSELADMRKDRDTIMDGIGRVRQYLQDKTGMEFSGDLYTYVSTVVDASQNAYEEVAKDKQELVDELAKRNAELKKTRLERDEALGDVARLGNELDAAAVAEHRGIIREAATEALDELAKTARLHGRIEYGSPEWEEARRTTTVPMEMRTDIAPRPDGQAGNVYQTVESKLLGEAIRTINGDRLDQYGAAENSFPVMAELWSTWLTSRWEEVAYPRSNDQSRIELEASDVAMLMVLYKIGREANAPKRDNRVDGAGYIGLYERLVTPQEDR